MKNDCKSHISFPSKNLEGNASHSPRKSSLTDLHVNVMWLFKPNQTKPNKKNAAHTKLLEKSKSKNKGIHSGTCQKIHHVPDSAYLKRNL
jgi:hypothetical protein